MSQKNKRFKLRTDLPEDISGKKQILFDVKSLKSEKDVNPDFYHNGFNKVVFVSGKLVKKYDT